MDDINAPMTKKSSESELVILNLFNQRLPFMSFISILFVLHFLSAHSWIHINIHTLTGRQTVHSNCKGILAFASESGRQVWEASVTWGTHSLISVDQTHSNALYIKLKQATAGCCLPLIESHMSQIHFSFMNFAKGIVQPKTQHKTTIIALVYTVTVKHICYRKALNGSILSLILSLI